MSVIAVYVVMLFLSAVQVASQEGSHLLARSCYESDSENEDHVRLCELHSDNWCFSTWRQHSNGAVHFRRGCASSCEPVNRNRKVKLCCRTSLCNVEDIPQNISSNSSQRGGLPTTLSPSTLTLSTSSLSTASLLPSLSTASLSPSLSTASPSTPSLTTPPPSKPATLPPSSPPSSPPEPDTDPPATTDQSEPSIHLSSLVPETTIQATTSTTPPLTGDAAKRINKVTARSTVEPSTGPQSQSLSIYCILIIILSALTCLTLPD